MKPWMKAFHRFGYCSVPIAQLETGETTNAEIDAFAEGNRCRVIRTTERGGVEMPLIYSVGISKLAPLVSFGQKGK